MNAPPVATAVTRIAAPAEAVWRVLVALDAYALWHPALSFDAKPEDVGVGAVVPAHISDDEEPGQEVTLTIVEVEAPHRLVWEGGSPDALLGRHTFVLTQQQDDTTEFTDSEEFYGPAAPDLVPALGQLTDRSAQYGAALRTRVEHLAD
ncbi:SRPBCC domain-containing protein [Streptomyces sp. AD2-2]|nr:SRPBCC domain-containing protein [Streptomyces sp. AD2-2]